MLISVRLILEMWLFDINRLTHYWFYFILADKTIFTVTIGSYIQSYHYLLPFTDKKGYRNLFKPGSLEGCLK